MKRWRDLPIDGVWKHPRRWWRGYIALSVVQTVAIVAALPATFLLATKSISWITVAGLSISGVMVAVSSAVLAAYGGGREIGASRVYVGMYWFILFATVGALVIGEDPVGEDAVGGTCSSEPHGLAQGGVAWFTTLAVFGMILVQMPHVVKAGEFAASPVADSEGKKDLSIARIKRAAERTSWLRIDQPEQDYVVDYFAKYGVFVTIIGLVLFLFSGDEFIWIMVPLFIAGSCKLIREWVKKAWVEMNLPDADSGDAMGSGGQAEPDN